MILHIWCQAFETLVDFVWLPNPNKARMSQNDKDGLSGIPCISSYCLITKCQFRLFFFHSITDKKGVKKQIQMRVLPPTGRYAWCWARAGPCSHLPQLAVFTWDIMQEIVLLCLTAQDLGHLLNPANLRTCKGFCGVFCTLNIPALNSPQLPCSRASLTTWVVRRLALPTQLVLSSQQGRGSLWYLSRGGKRHPLSLQNT